MIKCSFMIVLNNIFMYNVYEFNLGCIVVEIRSLWVGEIFFLVNEGFMI